MDNRHEEQLRREIPDYEILHELLARLNDLEPFEPISRSETVTVEDVAEALHLDPEYVAQELEAILDEHRDARLSGVIRELEEPLYRVERTGHAVPDSLGNPLLKLRSVQILTERNRVRPVLPRRKLKESNSERMGYFVGKFMLILMFALMALMGIKAIIAIALQR